MLAGFLDFCNCSLEKEKIMEIIKSQNDLLSFIKEELTSERNLSIRGVARLCGVDHKSLISSGDFKSKKLAEKLSSAGFQSGDLVKGGFPAKAVWLTVEYFAWESKAKAEMAKQIARTFGMLGVMQTFEKLSEDLPTQSPRIGLVEVAESTNKMYTAISGLEASGDLQLAQLLKSTLGNLILAENQKLLSPAQVDQVEGAVDVAIRLGFSVPKNYEGSLGLRVKKDCSHLLVGKNNRYSTASHKQVPANMYPANHPEVEASVRSFCVEKAFYCRAI